MACGKTGVERQVVMADVGRNEVYAHETHLKKNRRKNKRHKRERGKRNSAMEAIQGYEIKSQLS